MKPEFTNMLKTDDVIYPNEEAILFRLVGENEVVEMSQGIIENERVRVLSGPLMSMERIVK